MTNIEFAKITNTIMERRLRFMNPIVMKVTKIAVKVLGVAVPLAAGYFSDKELDDKIAKKAAEAVANQMKES